MPDGAVWLGSGTPISVIDQGNGKSALAVDNRANGAKTITVPTVDTSARQVLAANPNRKCAFLANNGSATIFVGTSNAVSTANGYPIPAGQSLPDVGSSDAWFAIVASATGDLRVLEIA